jgi:transposase-like protein
MKTKIQQVATGFNQRYTFSFKKRIVDAIENGRLSKHHASAKYAIDRSTIQRWCKKYGTFGKISPFMAKTPQQEIKALKSQIKELEMQKEILSLAMDMMEEETGLGLKKKYLPDSLNNIKPVHIIKSKKA